MPAIELHFGDQDLGKYKIVKATTIVGRDPTADIVIDNLGISRHHCQIEKRGPVFVAKDLESSNGTFVGGAKISEHNLNDGDEITIGKYRLVFRYTESAGQAAASQPAPAAKAPAADSSTAPDTLQTYVMDGKSIREQLKQMEQKGGAAMSAAEHAAMMDPLKPRGITVTTSHKKDDEGGYKTLLMLSLVLNIILIILMLAAGVLVVSYVMKLDRARIESMEDRDAEAYEEEAVDEEIDLSGEGILLP
ncbi:MAG TPA: FHA domain-containing protein [Planctomycetes bacterium]|nr:FHA domain-containing protein [Planctomycetota bacterium]